MASTASSAGMAFRMEGLSFAEAFFFLLYFVLIVYLVSNI